MSNREKAAKAREALKEIRHEIDRSLEGDRNPHRGDLMRLDRIALKVLKETS